MINFLSFLVREFSQSLASEVNGSGKTGKVNKMVLYCPFSVTTQLLLGSSNPKYVEFMEKNYPPGFSYPEFGPMFTAEFFDPPQWADILKSSGAK